MFKNENIYLENGKEVLFGLYVKIDDNQYKLLGQFASMEDVLNSNVIENTSFQTIIMDCETEIVGQD